MKIKSGMWIVVADGSRGLVLVNEGDALEPSLKVIRVYEQDNPKTSEQGRDRPARSFQSFSDHRSAMAGPDLHRRAEDRFVEQIITDLAKDAEAGAFVAGNHNAGVFSLGFEESEARGDFAYFDQFPVPEDRAFSRHLNGDIVLFTRGRTARVRRCCHRQVYWHRLDAVERQGEEDESGEKEEDNVNERNDLNARLLATTGSGAATTMHDSKC